MNKYILIPDLAKLIEESKTTKKELLYNLYDECNRYFKLVLSKEHPKGSSTYMGMAIVNLSLMFLLTKEKKYLDEAIRFIDTVCDYKEWGFAHLVNVDLSASWILFGLSLAYNWLFEYLSLPLKVKVFNKLKLQSKIMYEYKLETEGHGWSTAYFQNHNWINLTGLACCGYALKSEFPLAKDYIDIAKKNFQIVYSLMPNDGSNYEGIVYWRYGGMWLFVYADLLNIEEGINYFETCDYLKNTFNFRVSQSSADLKRGMNFGDCHDRYSSHSVAVYYKIASVYNNGYAQTLGNMVNSKFLYEEKYQSGLKPGILAEAGLALLWYNPEIAEKSLEELPKSYYFEDLGLISIRTGYDKDSTVFSFKCGRPGGKKQWIEGNRLNSELGYNILSLSHHHPDNLSFILNKGHSYFFIDDGYNRNILPHNHSVLLVDSEYTDVMDVNDVYLRSVEKRVKDNPKYNPLDYYGEILYYLNDKELTIFKADNTRIYPLVLDMKEVSRTVITDNLDFIIMVDEFKSDKPHIYSANYNLDSDPIVNNNKLDYIELGDKLNLEVFSNEKINYCYFDQEVRSVMTTQEPDKICYTKLHTVMAKTEIVKEQTLITTIGFNDKYSFKYENNILRINDEKYLLFVNYFDLNFDARALYVEFSCNVVKRIIVIDGTKVKYKGNIVFESKDIETKIVNI